MKLKLLYLGMLIIQINSEKTKSNPAKTVDPLKHRSSTKTLMTSTEPTIVLNKSKINRDQKNLKDPQPIDTPKTNNNSVIMLKAYIIQQWASEIQEKLIHVESRVVRRDFLKKSFSDFNVESRNGAAIVDKMATALDELLSRRAEAAEAIGRQAEKLATAKARAPDEYIFDNSIAFDKLKKFPDTPGQWEIATNCSSTRRVPVESLSHFGNGTQVQLEISSVKVATEIFDCDPAVLQHVFWSEGLLPTFRQNYAQDTMIDFQYFCSVKGFLRHYPAASWESMFKLKLNEDDDDEEEGVADVYDCRLRPWYVAASGAPRDILVLFDSSGSMVNSSNKFHANQFTYTLLSALTDDDQVNIYLFNNTVKPLIECFRDTLVPANHINTAAMMAVQKQYESKNETKIVKALTEAVRMLKYQNLRTDKPRSCQQAIILLSDSINENYTEVMKELDPSGKIRLFVVFLHDKFGLRDSSMLYGEWLGCSRDGYFAELVTDYDVTDQVMKILRVLERPLVHQRKERLRVFSDVYAHVEDPRRSEYYWKLKENAEQGYRYRELRRDKGDLLSEERMYRDYMHHESLNLYGQYYEETKLDYRLQISVSVPVFEDTTVENITIKLAEEKQRDATRTYPVNRLLGVAGVDIPIEHLKWYLPYYMLGACGSLFIIDHRGNIILHDNIKPTFEGDILRPGYRTVDILDLEQSADDHIPRNYSTEWLQFRKTLVIDQSRGSRVMYSKNIFEFGLRAFLERREYHWRRIHNHYTAVVALPKGYDRRHIAPSGVFTQQLAAKALLALNTDHSVHPDWLYCKHVEQQFSEPELEVRHFLRRRTDEPNFQMEYRLHSFTPRRPLTPKPLDKSYMCNEVLIARLCHEAIATERWAEDHDNENHPNEEHDCVGCQFGSVTAFFASESGLTRWKFHRSVTQHAPPPGGNEWPRGPDEIWYKRAVASPNNLIVHAPVTPIRKFRKREEKPPPFKIRDIWLTAARAVEHSDKGTIGVAGYHFHPRHLEDLMTLITNSPCEEEKCEQRCDGENWRCILIDEGGWVVAGHYVEEETMSTEGPAREHLARLYPHVMKALLNADVFTLHWIHDYQAVCFPPEEEELPKSASKLIPTLLKNMWYTVVRVAQVARETFTLLGLVTSGEFVRGETKKDKQKRHSAILKSYEREKFDRLYDERVLVNRTRIAACDRSRVLYQLQRNQKALEKLREGAQNCTWPIVGAIVPRTNLVLLAILNVCPPLTAGREVPDPLINEPMVMDDPSWGPMTSATKLACWRNRAPLPVRAPATACFPHNYTAESGYRQCGPWIPDPEIPDTAHSLIVNIYTYSFALILPKVLIF